MFSTSILIVGSVTCRDVDKRVDVVSEFIKGKRDAGLNRDMHSKVAEHEDKTQRAKMSQKTLGQKHRSQIGV